MGVKGREAEEGEEKEERVRRGGRAKERGGGSCVMAFLGGRGGRLC